MKLKRLLITTIAFVVVSVVIGAVLYPRLPDRIPTHFGLHSVPDGFTAKPLGVFMTPIVLVVLGLVFAALPRISPKGWGLDSFLSVYEIIAIAVLTVEFVDGMLRLYQAMGNPLDVHREGTIGIGVLLVVLGNFLGKTTRNFFVGIRTPWTLASPEVWLRTHRIGGVLFVAGGGVILVHSFVGSGAPYFALWVIGGIALFLVVYSYLLYRRIELHGSPSP